MRKSWIPIFIALITTAGVFTGVEQGNRLFRSGEYEEAVEAYRAALAEGADGAVVRYNLGTALLELGRYAEAEEQFRAALDAVDPELREWVYYNLGQRYLHDARQSEEAEAAGVLYDAAVAAYRQALRLRPGDGDAKWNYELAFRERDQQQRGGGGASDDPDAGEEPDQPGEGEGGGGTGDPSESDRSMGSGADEPMSQEQAERILSAVEQDERELFRDKLRKGQQAAHVLRDW